MGAFITLIEKQQFLYQGIRYYRKHQMAAFVQKFVIERL